MKSSYSIVEQLLLQKRFEELTASERAQVGLGSQAYTQQRLILLRSQDLLQDQTVPPPPANRLAALQAHYQQQHPPTPFWQWRVPVYQVALLLLGALILAILYWPMPTVQEKIVYQVQTDTVVTVQEKIVVEEKVVYQTKIQTVRVVERDTIYVPQIDRERFYQDQQKPIIFAAQPKGKSMKEMEGLLDFVGANP